ncbi:MAG: hypothetical protein J7M34_07660 [Anaerolineae bacterium]|nr:hypothetical protein [Anaerolineae bacterium]
MISDPIRGTVDIAADPNATIGFAEIDAAASGDTTIVSTPAGKRTKVLGVFLMANGDVNVQFRDGPGGGSLTGTLPMAAKGNGFVMPVSHQGYPWFQTGEGVDLVLNLSAAVQVGGCVVYYQE